MPPPVLNQSQINAGIDQIYLDTATELRLNGVGSTVGLPRPLLGLANDAEFRAMVRRIAQKRKLTRDAFLRLMETCIGPQFARRTALREAAVAGDQFLEVEDASVFTPVGTVLLNATQSTEDAVRFVFRDVVNNRLTLDKPLTFNHSIVVDASSRVRQDVAVAATSVLLIDSSKFPTSGYPYPVLLGQGREDEEIVLVTNNNTATNTLTLLAGTVNEHLGPVSKPVNAKVQRASVAGQYYLDVTGISTAVEYFPPTGWVRIDKGLGSEEVVQYSRLDAVESVLYFDRPLSQPHAVNGTVDLVEPGQPVSTAGVVQMGTHWDVYETQPNQVTLYIPEQLRRLFLRDASWLHDAVIAPVAATLTSNYNPPDLEIDISGASTLPSGGLYQINGVETFFAVNLWPDSSKLRLAEPLFNPYVIGDSILPVQSAYAGTDLADGNPIDPGTGDWDDEQFPGHYVYNPLDYAPSVIQTELAEIICDRLRVTATSSIGSTCLEVTDAATWPTAPFTPFDVIVGSRSGFEETLSCVDVTRAVSASTTTTGNIPGDVLLNGVNTSSFPDTGLGGEPAGYRLIIDRGGANEEIVVVFDNDTALNEFSVPAGLAFGHLAGESIELLNDVLTFSSTMSYIHYGPRVNPSREGVLVERPYSSISVTNGTSFPTVASTVWLNFGHGRIDARSRIVSVVGAVVTLVDTSAFPTTSYPYPVVLSQGAKVSETVFVTNNNTGTNELTLSGAPVNAHAAGALAAFTAGVPETVDYATRTGNVLNFLTPVVFDTRHTVGETVIYSPGESEPNDDGTGYQFFLPPDPALCLRSVLDLVRAAGVEVLVITER